MSLSPPSGTHKHRLYCTPGIAIDKALAGLTAVEAVATPPIVDEPCLWVDQRGVALLTPGRSKPFRLNPDKFRQRLSASTDLVRACGVSRRARQMRVLDAFGGFCIDALTLAEAGASVVACEQHVLVHALAQAFVSQFRTDVTLYRADGVSYLQSRVEPAWDVIYLDPMFSPRSKAALPGLPAQILRELNANLMQPEHEALDWLQLALDRADKVVFKRPLKDPVIGKPNHQFKGRSVRFDVYR